jgi:hypothetical protein
MRPIPESAIADHDFVFVSTKRYVFPEVRNSEIHHYKCNKCKILLCVIENPELCIKDEYNSLAFEQGWYYEAGTYSLSYKAQQMSCIDRVIKDIIE